MSRKHITLKGPRIKVAEFIPKEALLPELRQPSVLAAMLEKEKQRRSDECLKELQAVLAKWNCALRAQPGITPQGTITARVLVVPLEAPAPDGQGGNTPA